MGASWLGWERSVRGLVGVGDDVLVVNDELEDLWGVEGGGRVGRIWHGVAGNLWRERPAVTGRFAPGALSGQRRQGVSPSLSRCSS